MRSTASHRSAAASDSSITISSTLCGPAASINGRARFTPMIGTCPFLKSTTVTSFKVFRLFARGFRGLLRV